MPEACYEFKSLGLKTNFEVKKYSKAKHCDRTLELRVIQFLNDNTHKAFISADSLVDHLRQQYPEYSRRQRAAIKYQAGRTVAKLCSDEKMDTSNTNAEHAGSDDDTSNYSNISSDDEITTTGRESLPNMNSTLTELYKSSALDDSAEVSHDEFINISSDDNIESGLESSDSVSTITLDDDQVNNVGSSECSSSRKRKLSEQDEVSPAPSASSEPIPSCNNVGRSESIPLTDIVRKKKKPRRKKNTNSTTLNKSIVDELPTFNIPTVSFADVAGSRTVLFEIARLMMHIHHPEIYERIGIDAPRGFLLHGPPGCGKTLLAHAVAGELQVPLIDVAAPELVAGVSGISEQRIRKLFDNALNIAPCVLFIDEIDCITQNREVANKDMEKRIVSQLLSSMDKLNRDPKGAQVLVIGATNRPDSLDPALRRAGRFDREVCVGIPDRESRYEILKFMCSKLRFADDVCLREVATNTPGYVGADLLSLIRESALSSVHRVLERVPTNYMIPENCEMQVDCELSHSNQNINSCGLRLHGDPSNQLEKTLHLIKNKFPIDTSFLQNVCVTKDDLSLSLKRIQPSSKREGFVTIPDVTWNDVGSLKDIRESLQLAILAPVKYPKYFSDLGLPLSMGVLLCGPPGCGKTLLAKAVANEAGINFISVKGPELLNMYVGGSEKAVRECFQRAKNSQPCVIFFDELDALCPKRSSHAENSAGMRVVNQLLTEMDGVEGRTGVFLMAATNRPDIIDPAVLRPGRLDKILYVGFPNEIDRIDILKTLTKNGTKPPLSEDVDLANIAKNVLCDGFTGADLAALVRDASLLALSEVISVDVSIEIDSTIPVRVTSRHFEQALQKLRPSVPAKDRLHYENLRLKFATSAYQLQECGHGE